MTTYGQGAWMAGRPRALRAVAQIMSQNKDGKKSPAIAWWPRAVP
jgi:alkylated DNA nucleotide flippase Atl1